MRTVEVPSTATDEISRFPHKERPHMPGSLTTPGRSGTRVTRPPVLPSAMTTASAPGTSFPFAARWLAYALPCRRFAAALTDDDARLGADVDRYSFIVTDLHRLLLAGLPAHSH